MSARLSLHVPEPSVRPGGQARFQPCRRARGGRGPASADRRQPFGNPRLRLYDDPRARRSRRGGRRLGGGAHGRRVAQRPARHDADARLRRAHALVAAPGQDLVLHYLPRRGGCRDRPSQGARARRHVLCDLPPAGAPDRARLAAGRHDVRDLLQREGPTQGTSAPRPLFVEGGGLLHRLRQSRHPISPGRGLGDGLGDHGGHEHRLGLDRRRRRPPRPISIRRWCSPRSTARRSSSTSSTTSGRSPPIRASPAARAPNSPPARMATASLRCASTATTISRSTPCRNGRPSGRAPIWGRPSSNGSPTAPAPIRLRTIHRNTGRRTNGPPGRSAIRSRG